MPDLAKRFNVGGGSPWSAQEAVRNLMSKFYELSQMMGRFGMSFLHLENVLGRLSSTVSRLGALTATAVLAGGRLPGRILSSGVHHAVIGATGGHGGGGGVDLGGGGRGAGREYNPNWDQETIDKHNRIHANKMKNLKEEEDYYEARWARIQGRAQASGATAARGGAPVSAEELANLRARHKSLLDQAATYPEDHPKRIQLTRQAAAIAENVKIQEAGLPKNTLGPIAPLRGPSLSDLTKPVGMIGPQISENLLSSRRYKEFLENRGIVQRTVSHIGSSKSKEWSKFAAGAGGIGAGVLGMAAVAHGLVNAASPDAASTLDSSFSLLAGTIGQALIPTFLQLSAVSQRLANTLAEHPGLTQGLMGTSPLVGGIGGLADVTGEGSWKKKLGGVGDIVMSAFGGPLGAAINAPLKKHLLGEEGDPDVSGLLMSIRSMRAQPRYSSVEEAYKNIQVAAVSQDPLEAKLYRMHTQYLIKMIENQGKQLGLEAETKQTLEDMKK